MEKLVMRKFATFIKNLFAYLNREYGREATAEKTRLHFYLAVIFTAILMLTYLYFSRKGFL